MICYCTEYEPPMKRLLIRGCHDALLLLSNITWWHLVQIYIQQEFETDWYTAPSKFRSMLRWGLWSKTFRSFFSLRSSCVTSSLRRRMSTASQSHKMLSCDSGKHRNTAAQRACLFSKFCQHAIMRQSTTELQRGTSTNLKDGSLCRCYVRGRNFIGDAIQTNP